ncbi:MAG: CPBP family intramembrane metalloprotease [Treponema sp.]|jgi:membrane protease YdiL (CAAX protease family)|nr:CPBP family intramembrane metalloprotease [Treponema sp.]
MGIYFEALILYILIFLPATVITGAPAEPPPFSASATLAGTLLFYIPALALIWCLISRSWKVEYWLVKPGRKDLFAFVITLPCLLIISFVTSFTASYIGGAKMSAVASPSGGFDWAVLCFSCIFAAYLEESYFRFYLLARREELNLDPTRALALSVLLFSICHIYEGPWGFLNAVIAGTFLGFMFLKFGSLHGIAVAHGLYNIAVYGINTFSS